MRPLHLAIILGTGLFLQGCAGTPAKTPTAEGKIVNSIMQRRLPPGHELSCPSNAARYCKGTDSRPDCVCVSRDSVRQMFSGGY